MSEEKRKSIEDTIRVLMQLDKNSLLIIDSGAKLLAARQEMDRQETHQKEANPVCRQTRII